MSEHDEQVKVCQYLDQIGALYYAVPNGAVRSPVEAAKKKAEGMKRGVPDLCVCEPRKGYHGLYIEMKFGKGRPTREQEDFIEALRRRNYFVRVCWSAEEAIAVIGEYLGPE